MDNKGNNKLVGIKVSIQMSRTLYIEVPNDSTEESIINEAKKQALLPYTALCYAESAMKRAGLKVSGIDLADWEVDNAEYNIIDK